LILLAASASSSQRSGGNWLGLADRPATTAIHAICFPWQQRIDAASEGQLVELIRRPKKIQAHLAMLLQQDPEMCLDILDALAVRIDIAVLEHIQIQAAIAQIESDRARAKSIINDALYSADAKVRQMATGAFMKLLDGCQQLEVASQKQIDALMQNAQILHAHLEQLRCENPQECLTIIEILAARTKLTSALVATHLEVALDLFESMSTRAEELADCAYATEDDFSVLNLISRIYEKCGRHSEARRIELEILLA